MNLTWHSDTRQKMCVKLPLRPKDPELTGDEKRRESALYLLHRRRGRKFYDLLTAVELKTEILSHTEY